MSTIITKTYSHSYSYSYSSFLKSPMNMNVDYPLLTIFTTGLSAVCILACAMPTTSSAASGEIGKKPFGKMPDGTPVDLYTLRNRHGVEAKISNYGGIVVSIK